MAEKVNDRIALHYVTLVRWFELTLALVVLVGVVASAVGGASALVNMKWSQTHTLDDLIHRVLLLIIGLELVRMLVAHSLRAVLELLAFAIARKMLKPEITAIDITLGTFAFVALLGASCYFLRSASQAHMEPSAPMPDEG